ncbi:MAG TPA: DUF2723 domain-containing protein [Puia sp.]|jgi:hypothetical protein|nr:DUF2723 domain-containing protein [Puia sp.]
MNFKRINNISGWIVCAIACTVFILTREATVSFWDCGEFIPCAYRLEISHPPGAPLFILLGRLFIILFSGNIDAATGNPHAAVQVNLLSAMSSGFAILFLFWTTTRLAKRLMVKKDEPVTKEKAIVIIGAGAVGALAFTFSDSFWFSAVEGIVFGVSPLFISLAFWAIGKWDEQAVQPQADRWIVFIAYVVGLSIGVHLLSLLSIPAIVMTYYFRRFNYSRRGMILAFLFACVLTGVVQILVVQYSIKLMGWFELLFVNSMNLPFNSGCFFFIALLAAAIVAGIRWAVRKGRHTLELAIYCFAFILVGYSSYAVILVRANAGPAINMQNVNNPIDLVAYLDRDQYGEWPIVRGADFTARPTGNKDAGNIYDKDLHTGKYEVVGKKLGLEYDPNDIHWFPRIWDIDNSQGHVDYYKQQLGIDGTEPPSAGDNLRWLYNYQFNWMYWRYFMWNFAGRQNDLQGKGNPRDGNWISGISFVDNMRLGDQGLMPDSLKNNKARATLFFLPLLLGIAGLAYQWKRSRSDALVVFLLYFFTGIAIILYLNQAGPQPRERDYSLVGSFYAFSIYIGLGVLYVYHLLSKKLTGNRAAILASALCLAAVPVLMAFQEWPAHDRHKKTLARDIASDHLNTCPPQTILFTTADNDTYPLWYDQEVENTRPDIRVVITTLLGTEWMIDQLKEKVNESLPIPFSWSHDKYVGDTRNYIPYFDQSRFPKDSSMNLSAAMTFIGSDSNRLPSSSDEMINYMPTKNFYLPVDKATVLGNGTVSAADSAAIPGRVNFTFPGNGMYKNDLAELNIIAANNWERPVYFTFPPYNLGLENYVVNDGLAYRLTPIRQDRSGGIDLNKMYAALMTKFKFGGGEKPNVYFDENGRRELISIRDAFLNLGAALATTGNRDSALRVLNYGYKMIDPTTLPYGMVSDRNMENITSLQYANAFALAGDTAMATRIANATIRDCRQQLAYYNAQGDAANAYFQQDQQTAGGIIAQLDRILKNPNPPGSPKNPARQP